MIHKQLPPVLIGSTLAGAGIFWVLKDSIENHTVWIVWLGLVFLCNVLRYLHYIKNQNSLSISRLKTYYFLGFFTSGVLWAAAHIILSYSYDVEAIIILSSTTAITATIALISSAHFPPAYYAYCTPLLIATNFSFAQYKTDHGNTAVFMLLIFFSILINYARAIQKNSLESIIMKQKNESLVVELKHQEEITKKNAIDKSRFFSAISHDLRQPVHALNLFVNSIQTSSLDEHTIEIISNMKLSINAQENMFTEFLDMTKLDTGTITPKISQFSTQELLHDLVTEHAELASDKNLLFFCPATVFYIESDLLICKRILRNILQNAINYTTKGKISISIEADEERVTISIIDTGVGIDKREHEKIYSEFEQLTNPRRDLNIGLGLGLAIVKRYCDLLKIPILLSSELGKGSCFTLSFKRTSKQLNRIKHSHKFIPKTSTTRAASSSRILIIDDDSLVLKATKLQLETLGYLTSCASNLEEALNTIRNDNLIPDLILCDLYLQHYTYGVDVIAKINKFLYKEIPSIIITGETNKELINKVLKTDSTLLHKPIHTDKLIAAIESTLQAHNLTNNF